MRRIHLLVAGLALGPVAAGCGPEKELPTEVRVGTARDEPATPPIPSASDPEAVRIVDLAVRAATDGHPERLAKARANRVTLRGVVLRATGRVATTRRIQAAWPDRLVLVDEFNENGPLAITVGLRRPNLWIRRTQDGETTAVPVAEPEKDSAAYAADAVGRHWMALLVPLTDPKTVVFEPGKRSAGGRGADTLKAAVPGCPVFTLLFDDQTHHLAQVQFQQVEYDKTAAKSKVFGLAGYRAFDGLTLPAKIDYAQNGQLVEEWSVDGWEFPAAADEAAFDPPAAKK